MTARQKREDLDELAVLLFHRMLSRRPVWVDSPVGQRVWIRMVGLGDDGECIANDHEGNDRPVSDYLLTNPRRCWSDG